MVGRVIRVLRGTGMLLNIGVAPAVDFDSVERVFLLGSGASRGHGPPAVAPGCALSTPRSR